MKVRIAIRGRSYTVRSDEDEDLQAIASYVDGKMRDIGQRSPSVDEYTLAMLAALNIASEFDRFRRTVESDLGEADRELAAAAVLLDSMLPGAK
jgi:cell division protein ZapA (FtsZ GTPase activity inhibitor)